MALRMCKSPGCRGLAGPGMGGRCSGCQSRVHPPDPPERDGPRLYDNEKWRKGLYCLVADGEARAEVYSCATKRDQALIVFSEAKRMVKGSREVRRFAKAMAHRYLWVWWKRACAKLGIEGVDLYGGTRHSTVTALGDVLTPEQIKAGTLHSTSRAFERYFQGEARRASVAYKAARKVQHPYNRKTPTEPAKILKIKE